MQADLAAMDGGSGVADLQRLWHSREAAKGTKGSVLDSCHTRHVHLVRAVPG